MANTDSPFGLRPVRHLNGMPWNGQTMRMMIEDGDSTAVYIGDPVIITGSAGSDDDQALVCTRATAGAGNRTAGVVVSVEPINAGGDLYQVPYVAASTGRYVNVVVDPQVIFMIQDDAGATLDGDSLGTNAIFTIGTGSTYTGMSAAEIAAGTTPAADPNYQMLILDIAHVENNTLGSTHCIFEVLLSNHWLVGSGDSDGQGICGI